MRPEYRLRLFISVDLVGSTAYKTSNADIDPSKSPKPTWVRDIESFYKDFPDQLAKDFRRIRANQNIDDVENFPKVWKTIGDEIIFCCRIANFEHLAACVLAFKSSLNFYGKYLEELGKKLDVKGYGWIAAFPAPNISVVAETAGDLSDEETELKVDLQPGGHDFLGKDIDAGFRTSAYCSPSKLVLSIQLAYLLSEAARREMLPGVEFCYEGRRPLKGVLQTELYPVFFLNIERNINKREVLTKEQRFSDASKPISAVDVREFVQAFLKDVDIEYPVLQAANDQMMLQAPASYQQYIEVWNAINNEISKRVEAEQQAANADDGGDSVPDVVTEALTATLEDVQAPET